MLWDTRVLIGLGELLYCYCYILLDMMFDIPVSSLLHVCVLIAMIVYVCRYTEIDVAYVDPDA